MSTAVGPGDLARSSLRNLPSIIGGVEYRLGSLLINYREATGGVTSTRHGGNRGYGLDDRSLDEQLTPIV